MSGLLKWLNESNNPQLAGVEVSARIVKIVRSWMERCPNCDGEPVRLTVQGDRFNPAQHEECENPVCVGGFAPSDTLIDAVRGCPRPLSVPDVSVAVLGLLDDGGT